MSKTTPAQNKAIVLEAFDALFNKRDYAAAARFWSDTYIQHSAHIEPGREGLFNLVRSLPDRLRYQHGLIVAGGITLLCTVVSLAMGVQRPSSQRTSSGLKIGVLAEHWDVLQDEATQAQSKSGLPMFGDRFPS